MKTGARIHPLTKTRVHHTRIFVKPPRVATFLTLSTLNPLNEPL